MPSTVSDAERMDRHYRFQRHIYDATRTHYLIGRQHLIRNLKPPRNGTVLEIGAGTGWNLVRAARTYPDAKLYGLDVSSAMLATARASIDRKGLAHRIVLKQGDATAFSAGKLFGVPRFDRVFFSYALTMIPDWTAALDQAAPAIAPGGELHVVDFGTCEQLPASFRRLLERFLAHYTVHPRPDMEVRLSELAKRHGLALRFERLHRGYTSSAVLTRAATQ